MRNPLPKAVRRFLLRQTRRPPVGRVDFGDLRRLEPISRSWGGDRGTPVDRHYIERFLADSAADIRGRVLEIGNDRYARRFGGERVERFDVLDLTRSSPKVTLVANLSAAPEIPSSSFDCVICTQTLQLIPDVAAAVATLHRILKPSGVLLATVPTISQLAVDEAGRWRDYWRWTSHGMQALLAESFPVERLTVSAAGNLVTAVAFLHGISAEELSRDELEAADPRYEQLVTIRAVKDDAPTSG